MAKFARDSKVNLQSSEGLEELNTIIIELSKSKPDASKIKGFALKYGFNKSLHKDENHFLQDLILSLNSYQNIDKSF